MKTNEELNNESVQHTEKIISLLSEALSLVDEDAAMDARVSEHINNALNFVKEDLDYYKTHGVEDLNSLDDETNIGNIAQTIIAKDFGRSL